MANHKEIPEELIEFGRRLYEDTETPLYKIAEQMGICQHTLNARAAKLGWRPRGGLRRAGHADMAHLTARIRDTVRREIAAAERDLGKTGSRAARVADAERTARTLASLAKTLRELKCLDAEDKPRGAGADDEPIDFEEFKRELARRIDALCEDEQVDGPAGGVDP